MAINQIPPIFMDEKIMFSSSDVNTYTARFGLQKPCCMTLRLKAQMEIKFAKYVPSIIFIKILPFSKHYDGYSSTSDIIYLKLSLFGKGKLK